jgi:hypothetical protein
MAHENFLATCAAIERGLGRVRGDAQGERLEADAILPQPQVQFLIRHR